MRFVWLISCDYASNRIYLEYLVSLAKEESKQLIVAKFILHSFVLKTSYYLYRLLHVEGR